MFVRLSPDLNTLDAPSICERELTASLRCIISDTPMKAYLKRTKGHSGYWACDQCIEQGERINGAMQVRNFNAPLRNDIDFLQYFVKDVSDYSIDLLIFYWNSEWFQVLS